MSVKTQGCALRFYDTAVSPNAYVDIANVTGFQGPSGSRQVIDATLLASAAKIKDVGLPDMGQISGDFVFDVSDTVLTDVYDAFLAGTLQVFQIAFSDSPETLFDFSAYVLSFSYSASIDDVVRGSFTLEISGAVTDNLA